MVQPPANTAPDGPTLRQLAAEVLILGAPLLVVDAIQRSHPLASSRFHRIPPTAEVFAPGLRCDDPDCLTTSTILDLAAGPLVLHLPQMHGRYVSVTLFDSAGAPFANYGSHAWDRFPSDLAIAGPKWRGEVDPAARAVRAPSEIVWAVSRILARSACDLQAAEHLARRQHLAPMHATPSHAAARAAPPPLGALEWPQMRDILSAEPGLVLYRLRQLIERAPAAVQKELGPPISDGIALMGPAAHAAADRRARDALARGFEDGWSAIEAERRQLRQGESAWRVIPAPPLRQGPAAAQTVRWLDRIGAPMGEDILTLGCEADESGRPLVGEERYRILFSAAALPPTLYGWRLIARPLNAPCSGEVIGEHSGLKLGDRETVELMIQREPPDERRAVNWLAAPPGPFDLRLRLLSPTLEALKGDWRMAPVERLGSRAIGPGAGSPQRYGSQMVPTSPWRLETSPIEWLPRHDPEDGLAPQPSVPKPSTWMGKPTRRSRPVTSATPAMIMSAMRACFDLKA